MRRSRLADFHGAWLLSASAALGISCAAAPAHAEDAWWAKDKALHFGVSAGIGAAGYAASSLVFESRTARASAGAGLALSAGVGKEIYDSLGHGDPSWKDLTWDLAGAVVGVGLALALDVALSSPRRGGDRARAGLVLHF
jgi:uncharacterized protein YfiM (DUF2279 family)